MKRIFLITLSLLIIVGFGACVNPDHETPKTLSDYFNDEMTINLEPNYLLRTISKEHAEKSFDKISKLLLNNSTFLSSDLEPVSYEDNDVPWGTLTSTYNLNINSFNDIQFLIYFYEITNEKIYLEEAKKLILSWIQYEKSEESNKNVYVWYDHAVSYRTLVLIHFMLYEDAFKDIYDADTKKVINNYLKAHGEWLYKDKYYTIGNHGIMMDRALLELSFYIDDKDKREKYYARAIERLELAITRDFTSDGVHLENSPGYHRFVMEWFIEIKEFLTYYLDIPSNTILEIATTKASNYIVHAILPNKYLPRIGDTSNTDKPLQSYYNNEYLEYIISDGEEGIIPQSGLSYYEEAGILLYRDDFDGESTDKATWWCFKSGARSAIHKQDDDLSIMLYSNGNEILSDGGQYNYVSGDSFRQYVVSPEAHNSLSIKGKPYYGNANFDQIDLLELVNETNEYYWYKGINRAYGHTHIQRNLIFFEPNVFIIIDDGLTIDDQQDYTQHFLLGKDMELVEYDANGFKAISKDEKSWIELEQYIDTEDVKHYSADEQDGYGYISEYFAKKIPINYISFENTAKQTRYVTSIIINDEDNTDLSIDINEDHIIVNVNSKKYIFNIDSLSYEEIGQDLEDSLVVKKQSITKHNNMHRFELDTFNPNLLYAYYLYKDDIRIDFKDYSTENFYEFSPQEPGEYVVTYFIVKSDVEDIYNTTTPGTKQMGVFEETIDVDEEDIKNDLEQSLEIQAEELVKSESIYRYEIQTYNPDVLYAFYLYKDEQKIDFQDYSKQSYYEFKPTENGEYSVKWFIVRDNVKDKFDEPFGVNKKSGNSDNITISK